MVQKRQIVTSKRTSKLVSHHTASQVTISCELDKLLKELAGGDSEALRDSRRDLLAAIEAYHEHKSPDVFKTRRSLAQLLKGLRAAADTLDGLPFQARRRIATELGSLGPLRTILAKGLQAACAASTAANALPDRQPHYERAIFAYDVARVLNDRLMIPARLTRDDLQTNPGKRHGSTYARLLRVSLRNAGVKEIDNLYLDMKAGLDIFDFVSDQHAVRPGVRTVTRRV